jgi:acetolactate synthase-1/2/3 large subunit
MNFIDRRQIPVLLTWKAMEVLADDHPLFVGSPGAIGQVAANRIIQECDLLLVLGAAMNYDQVAYHLENIAPEAVKIVVDVDAVELDKYGDDWTKIHADVADIL